MYTKICYCNQIICECDCPFSLSLDELGPNNQCWVMAEVNLLTKGRFLASLKTSNVFLHTDDPSERSVNIYEKKYRDYIKERLKGYADACHKKYGLTK